MSQTLRKRTTKRSSDSSSSPSNNDWEVEVGEEKNLQERKESDTTYYIALAVCVLLAIYTRFNKLGTPDVVVFDEVHFGKYASYYLERSYFFDLHPPFAKLLIALVGYLIGFDGKFKFDNIGDSYTSQKVPYVPLRLLLAVEGTIIVPVVFLTLKTLNYSVPACFFASMLVCFENAQVIESRLILLDATLILSVAMAYFCYAKFSVYRHQPFSRQWWKWLYSVGISLSCVISTKYVGVFTYFSIGVAVLHELWYLSDYRRGLSYSQLLKHFFSRLWALIIVPFVLYLFWFYLHFCVLTKSGTGDSFMSSEFQETLEESPMYRLAKDVHYNDIITVRHKFTDAYLHSHLFNYPLRYEDGRISSNGQQVTCVVDADHREKEDVNNQWEILPSYESGSEGSLVYTNDAVRFRHVGTGGILLSHDVASPLRPTNEEFTVVNDQMAEERYNETLFRLRFAEKGTNNQRTPVQTKATPLRIVHVDTVVSMWTHDDELLPEWGLNHQEVNGNKKVQDSDNTWYIEDIVNLAPDDKRNEYVPKVVSRLPFLRKWWELQFLMFHHNNILSSEHPYASLPEAWPLALSGVSFWNDNEERKQIFFTGNVVGFWMQVGMLAIYVGIVMADQVTRHRNIHILRPDARSRLYNTLGFFFIGWCAHYFPFFLMGRQKFLHHYLPAHLIASLFCGGLIEFLSSNNTTLLARGQPGLRYFKLTFVVAALVTAVIAFFFFFRPVSYGDIYLPPEEIRKRMLFDIILHYSK